MRPPSRLIRTLRAVTAVITVWCLGCAALDPLIARLAGQPESAFTDRAPQGGAVAVATVDQESVCAAAPDGEPSSTTCDCQSCLAPAPAALASGPPSPPAPDDPAGSFAAPTSIERAPLVPPPQAVA